MAERLPRRSGGGGGNAASGVPLNSCMLVDIATGGLPSVSTTPTALTFLTPADNPLKQGTDFTLATDGTSFTVNVDMLLWLGFNVSTSTSAGGKGVLTLAIGGTITDPVNSPLMAWLSPNGIDIPVAEGQDYSGSGTKACGQVSVPPAWVKAGSTITVLASAVMASGTVDLTDWDTAIVLARLG